MADIFSATDARNMLDKKRVLFFGDSNIRAIYKDWVCLLKSNKVLRSSDLKSKLESSFMGDKLLKGSSLTRGRDFQEHRQFKHENVCLEFFFITRTFCSTVEDVIKAIKAGKESPVDAIIMNSCLWDLSRWGPNGVCKYKQNLLKLMKFLNRNLPQETLFIWTTALPISQDCYGGFLIKQVEFLKHTLRFEVMEANMYARDVVAIHGYDVLDLHYYFTMQICRRAKDGIHWLPEAVRFMTNLVLTHAALSWHYPLPGKVFNSLLDAAVNLDVEEGIPNCPLPVLPPCLDILSETCEKPAKIAPSTNSQTKAAPQVTNRKKKEAIMQTKPTRKRKPRNRQKMKQQQHQSQLVEQWISASHVPHPFGNLAMASALKLMNQELQNLLSYERKPRHVFTQEYCANQMGWPSTNYTSLELERFEWGEY